MGEYERGVQDGVLGVDYHLHGPGAAVHYAEELRALRTRLKGAECSCGLDEYRRGLRMARVLLAEWLEVQPAYQVSAWDVLEVLDEAIEASSVDPCPVIVGVRGRDPVWMEWVVGTSIV